MSLPGKGGPKEGGPSPYPPQRATVLKKLAPSNLKGMEITEIDTVNENKVLFFPDYFPLLAFVFPPYLCCYICLSTIYIPVRFSLLVCPLPSLLIWLSDFHFAFNTLFPFLFLSLKADR